MVGLGRAAGFIISIYFSSAHGAVTQFTRMISSISLCLLFVFSPTLGCDFLCFRLYTQSRDQSNVLKEIILPNFWLCERLFFHLLRDSLFRRQNLRHFFRAYATALAVNPFSLWLRKSMRWMSRESGVSHWTPKHFLFLMWALSGCFAL